MSLRYCHACRSERTFKTKLKPDSQPHARIRLDGDGLEETIQSHPYHIDYETSWERNSGRYSLSLGWKKFSKFESYEKQNYFIVITFQEVKYLSLGNKEYLLQFYDGIVKIMGSRTEVTYQKYLLKNSIPGLDSVQDMTSMSDNSLCTESM